MEVIGFIFIFLLVMTFGMLCYFKGELKGMRDNLKIIELHHEIVDGYEKRINTMQELIDYNEGIIHNAINTDLAPKKALKYIEDCYIIGDEIQYQEMENCDCDECISRDENAYNEIWGD